ncbi:phage holin, LLH family [Sporolactobacillus kofuensis]|uniref:Phage holin, LLH family n=1 Tax=Sporolactobacillus kofuensis TaxID=269672 RepID=A0ABW1WCX3_9BACL|nr:phage holin, LLH family [Sporolactobacillus kofuensis]MCO7174775.1 phage holin family protein [Sporolactobacillus kofuensis]
MQEFLKYVVDPVASVVIPALVAYILNVGVPYIIDKLMKSKAAFLVKAAESTFRGSDRGEEKYEVVADSLLRFARKRLLYFIKDEKLKAYIEAAVTELHAELPKAIEKTKKR